jgi:hypothetical protein
MTGLSGQRIANWPHLPLRMPCSPSATVAHSSRQSRGGTLLGYSQVACPLSQLRETEDNEQSAHEADSRVYAKCAAVSDALHYRQECQYVGNVGRPAIHRVQLRFDGANFHWNQLRPDPAESSDIAYQALVTTSPMSSISMAMHG